MADTYTSAAKARLIEDMTRPATWGPVLNSDALELIDDMASGSEAINLGTSTSYAMAALSNGTDSESRASYLAFTGTPASAVTVTIPASVSNKRYLVYNNCGQRMTVKYSASTGVVLGNGDRCYLWCDGSEVYDQGPGSRITDAEIAAAVTPVNYLIPSHDVIGYVIPDRYGTNTTPGTTDMYTAETAAQSVISQLPKGGTVLYLNASYYSSLPVLIYSHRSNVKGMGKHATNWTSPAALSHSATRVDADTFTVATDLTAIYRVGATATLTGATTEYVTVISSSYSAPNTTVEVSGTVPTSLTSSSVGVARFRLQRLDTSEVLYQCSVGGGCLEGSGTHQKIGIDAYDISETLFYELAFRTWTGNTSIGIRTAGREYTTFSQIDNYADRPFHIRRNANAASISSDHTVWRDVIAAAQVTTEDCILIDADTGIGNWSCPGYLALIGGTNGIRYPNGTEAAAALNIKFDNFRREQPGAAGGYAVEWHCSSVGLEFHNCGFGGSGSPTNNGLYLRNSGAVLVNTAYSGTGTSVNADSTCAKIETFGCKWQSGSTPSLTGLMVVRRSQNEVSNTMPETGLIMPTGNYEETLGAVLTGPTTTLAADAYLEFAVNGAFGQIQIFNVTDQQQATYDFEAGATYEVRDRAGVFSDSSATNDSINCYYDGGSATYRINNTYATSKDIRYRIDGKA